MVTTSAYNLKKIYSHTIQIGMPIRNDILKLYKNKYEPIKNNGYINLLILGGSQAATVLSYRLSKVIVQLPLDIKKKIIIFHQVKEEDTLLVRKTYKKNKIKSNVANFFNDVSKYLKKTSLVISRAGSSSIHENAIAGIPAIYFPINNSVGNHQYHNALFFKNKKAAWMFKEEDLDNGSFLKFLSHVITNSTLLKLYSINLKKLRREICKKTKRNYSKI